MNRKFQVFISSTYLDLQTERQAAVQAVLDAGHIPAGMELFAAGDQEQLEVIKRWIDESDIYMLILGVRYGSLEPKSKKSYTRLEYEYAVEQRKPIFAVYLADKSFDQRITDLAHTVAREDRAGYNEFRQVVKSKMCSEFNDPRDITIAVLKTLGDFARKPELQNAGWVRSRDLPDTSKLTSENSLLNIEVARLTGEVARLSEENHKSRAGATDADAVDDERIGRFAYRQVAAALAAMRIPVYDKKSNTVHRAETADLLTEFVNSQSALIVGVYNPDNNTTSHNDWLYEHVSPKLVPFGLVARGNEDRSILMRTTPMGDLFLAIYAIKCTRQES